MEKSSESKGDVFIHKEIIEKCKQGNPSAQYKLYKLYSKAMFNVCYRIMNNREEAEDMLQDAFADAFMKLDSFRYESSFGTWLKRNMINKCLNEIKRKKPDLVFCEDMSYFQKNEVCAEDYSKTLTIDNINKAMETLPSGGKLVFSLYLLEGYDHQEIAQILNIRVSSSRSQLLRAKRKVKAALMTMQSDEECVLIGQSVPSYRTSFIPDTISSKLCMEAV